MTSEQPGSVVSIIRESGFYYLQSRYYDPQIGRFINADAAEYSAMSAAGLSDTNLFVYCRNNPISNGDDDGYFINTVIGAVVGGVVAAITTDRNDPNYVEKVALGALTGAIGGLFVDAAIATGGASAIALAAGGGALSGFISSVGTQKMDTGSIDWRQVALDSAIGATLNTLSYGVSVPKTPVTTGGTLTTRIVQNSLNAMQAGALKTVTTRGITRTVQRANYNTIIATNKALSYATSSLIAFASGAYSRLARRTLK